MTNELTPIEQKRLEVSAVLEKTVKDYYGLDFAENNPEMTKKKQNIAMFVSKLISTVDKTGQPALVTASPDSIRECALTYVNGDFDFFRNQAYLIPYGNKLQLIVSKDGLVAGAKKVLPNLEMYSDIVYKGDKFEYTKVGGRTLITKHDQPIENITGKLEDIVCAYACAWINGEQVESEIMTLNDIRSALSIAHRSITDFHKNSPKIMFGKFPLRRLAKRIINQNTAPEVARVFDEDNETIIVDPEEPNDTPVSIDFKEEPQAIEEPKKATRKKKTDAEPKDDNAPLIEIGETMEINYDDWATIYKPMDIYEPLKDTLNKETMKVLIKRVK